MPPQSNTALAPVTTTAPATATQASGRPLATKPQKAAATDPTTDFLPSQTCNLEGIGGTTFGLAPVEVRRGVPVLANGWAGIDASKTAPTTVMVRIALTADAATAWEVALPVDARREDVAKAMNSPAMANSGFSSAIDFSDLPAGDYHLFLTYQDGAQHIYCDNGRHIQLVD